jgi:radical SAM protein with 4Fe4S-binding SPASM domain
MRFKRIYVELSNMCNLNCSFCSKDKREKRALTIEEFEYILNQIKKYTNLIYLHIKGEPLLYKKIEQVFELCKKNNIKIKITTNGIYLNKYINTINKYDNIVQINISLMCENNDNNYLDKIIETSSKIKTTIVYRVWLINKKSSNLILEKILKYYKKENIGKNIKLNDHIYLDKDIEFTWPNKGKTKTPNGICYGTRTHIGILSNGEVVPCCLDSEGELSFGNIFKNNIEEILNSSKFITFNDKIKKGIMPSELCQKCDFKKRLNKQSV